MEVKKPWVGVWDGFKKNWAVLSFIVGSFFAGGGFFFFALSAPRFICKFFLKKRIGPIINGNPFASRYFSHVSSFMYSIYLIVLFYPIYFNNNRIKWRPWPLPLCNPRFFFKRKKKNKSNKKPNSPRGCAWYWGWNYDFTGFFWPFFIKFHQGIVLALVLPHSSHILLNLLVNTTGSLPTPHKCILIRTVLLPWDAACLIHFLTTTGSFLCLGPFTNGGIFNPSRAGYFSLSLAPFFFIVPSLGKNPPLKKT